MAIYIENKYSNCFKMLLQSSKISFTDFPNIVLDKKIKFWNINQLDVAAWKRRTHNT